MRGGSLTFLFDGIRGGTVPVDFAKAVDPAPLPPTPECIEEGCSRPPYDEEGRCKKHHDIELWRRESNARSRDPR